MSISNKLRDYIEENNISKDDISKLTGISLSDLDLSLNNERKLTFEEFEKMLIVLEESADKFIIMKDEGGLE